jgi:hypothetical protein
MPRIALENLAAAAQHLAALAALAGPKATHRGPDLYRDLARVESRTHLKAEAYCNGELEEAGWERAEAYAARRVAVLFGGTPPPGFFVNADPRGCALKCAPFPGLLRDWGGNGLLAPDFS